ncbi:hypothetical protein DH2020_024725 [Rehmannia glutinosa]|uniref:Saccharopine dehydrogenase NADP binding domain-containing protein n=1 Tax=Rehmannia glutinosa TaxID=99300 RepID=A0ABR0W1K4_REHGL
MAFAKETGKQKSSSNIERVELPEKVKNSRILILGGTGRVGGSTALALSKFCPDLRIVIGGRNRDKGAEMVTKLGNNTEFSEVDINDSKSLEEALKDVDLVVHTAGPFQQAEKCTVLEAAIQNKGRCDLMAAELVRAAKSEGKGEPQRLRFYYYTAGSGGAGPTILSTSFLLLGEEVVAYSKGEKIKLKPYSGMLNIDFGEGIGKKDVFLLNLPEVRSIHEVLGVPTVSARFGTAPFFWNWGMVAMTYLLPAVDLDCSDGRSRIGVFSHKKLSKSVGISTAAFVLAILEGSTQPGVWFPEEVPQGIAIEARETLLSRAAQGTFNFVMNKAPGWLKRILKR